MYISEASMAAINEAVREIGEAAAARMRPILDDLVRESLSPYVLGERFKAGMAYAANHPR